MSAIAVVGRNLWRCFRILSVCRVSTQDFKPSIHVVSKIFRPKTEVIAGRKRSTPRVEAVVVHWYGNQVARVAHYVSR